MDSIPILLAVLIATLLSDPWAWLRQAESYANQGYCARAANMYKMMMGLGFSSPDLDYNLGACALAHGDLSLAIYHFRRAVEQEPYCRDYADALLLAREYVVDAIPPPRLHGQIGQSLRTAALMTWLCGWCIAFAAHFQRGQRLAAPGLFLVAVSLGLVALGAYIDCQEQRSPWAVICKQCMVRTGNGESYAPYLQNGKPLVLYPGAEVKVLGHRSNSWSCIALQDGQSGWLPDTSIYVSGTPIQWR